MKKDLWQLFTKARAVLFDLDGVVIDSDSLHNEAKLAALKYYGFAVEKKDWGKIKYHATSQIFERLRARNLTGQVTADEFMARKSNYFSQLAPTKINLVSGVITFIQSLKDQGIKLALVTATRREAFDFFNKKFTLSDYFEVIITADDVKNLKPDPEAYLRAMNLLGFKASDCIVIEDTAIGVQSGKSAGCLVVGKESTIAEDILLTAGAVAVFKDFKDLK